MNHLPSIHFQGELLVSGRVNEWGLRKIGHRIEAPSQGVGWGVLLGGLAVCSFLVRGIGKCLTLKQKKQYLSMGCHVPKHGYPDLFFLNTLH